MDTCARVSHAPWIIAACALVACASSACNGTNGSNGAPGPQGIPGPSGPPGGAGEAGASAVDRGSISGTVQDAKGNPLQGAIVTTNPSSATDVTTASGGFTLASIPVGAYSVIASKSGYVSGGVNGVGVGGGGTTRVSITLAAVAATTGALGGTILGRQSNGAATVSKAVPGATVCVEGPSGKPCATSAEDGTYAFSGLPPGPVFVSAYAAGWLPGETRQAANVSAGVTTSGVDVTLSGSPPAGATYVGSARCVGCHGSYPSTAGIVAAWQGSAHANSVSTGPAVSSPLSLIDEAGWPPPGSCTAASIAPSGVSAPDPGITTPGDEGTNARAVFLVRWGPSCGAGKPAFAMALDTNQNGHVDFDGSDTVMEVDATQGGVATGAGQCGQGGILPAYATCSASYPSGVSTANGWWQQEYLENIGPSSKPSWVTWDTTGAPGDTLALPLAWNQRANPNAPSGWMLAPDYNPTQAGTSSQVCTGCHATAGSITTDANGMVTAYSAEQAIGCERCHGPGSAHANSMDAKLIISPSYLTARAQNETCGQCHSNGVASANPAGAFDFAWNRAASLGGGNFVPGVDKLSDFASIPLYGDPDFYWPSGFPSIDHITYVDLGASAHDNNSYEKLVCTDCHEAHSVKGGPYELARTDEPTLDRYVFQSNDAFLRDDVGCLACHASHGPFAAISLADVGRYHVSMGGSMRKNGEVWTPSSADQATSASLVANTVDAHMIGAAAMPAYFDPTGTAGQPVARCSSCHMPKTAFTAQLFTGPDSSGQNPGVPLIGDVSSHTFQVAWPTMSLATGGAMPNACGSCHQGYRVP